MNGAAARLLDTRVYLFMNLNISIFIYCRKTWQDQDFSLQAETSPDSLASAASTSGAGPEVKYEGFTEFNYNNKPNVNLSWKSYEFTKVKFYL